MFLGAKATGEVDDNRGIRGRSRGIADSDSALIVCNETQSDWKYLRGMEPLDPTLTSTLTSSGGIVGGV